METILSISLFTLIASAIMSSKFFNMVTSSITIISLLFIFGIIDENSLQQGILGTEYIKPWKITSIFFILFLIQDIIFYYIQKKKNLKISQFGLPTPKSNLYLTLKSIPWNIAPFIFALFILTNEFSISYWNFFKIGFLMSSIVLFFTLLFLYFISLYY